MGKNSTIAAGGAMRREEAARLRAEGLTFQAIADKLGVDKSRAYRLVADAIAAANHRAADSLEVWREREWAITDVLLEQLMVEFLGGVESAFDRIMRVLERRAKYRGIDIAVAPAPQPLLPQQAMTDASGRFLTREQMKVTVLERIQHLTVSQPENLQKGST